IVVDGVFSGSTDPKNDDPLVAEMSRDRPIITVSFDEGAHEATVRDEVAPLLIPAGGDPNEPVAIPQLVMSMPRFMNAAGGVGHTFFWPGPDGLVRGAVPLVRIYPDMSFGQALSGSLPSVSLLALA